MTKPAAISGLSSWTACGAVFHPVGKPVADALALLLIVAHRPTFLPVLIFLPALRGGAV
jgi:hypothetical protein